MKQRRDGRRRIVSITSGDDDESGEQRNLLVSQLQFVEAFSKVKH